MNENYFDNDAQSRNAHDESREGYGQPQHERNTGNDAPQNNESRPRAKRPRFNSSSRVTSSSNFTRNTTPQRGNYGGQGQRPYRQRTDYRDNPYDQPRTRYGSYDSDYDEHSAGYRPRPAQGATAGPRRPYRPQYEQEGRPAEGYRPAGAGYGRPATQRPRPAAQPGGYKRPAGNNRPGYNPHAKYSLKKQIEYRQEHYDPNEPIRLNKYLANAGVCSRRDADKFIEAGLVTVNGVTVTELGTKVLRSDEVMFHDKPVRIEKKVYVLLNKPKGYVTTSEDPENRKTVMDLVGGAGRERIYPVGRLDRNTTGVLLLTNDGDLASKLTHPKYLKKKIYHVTCDKNVTAADLHQIAEGIHLEDGDIRADAIDYASPTDKSQVGIEIHSGRNRIVRRIFETLGYHVVKLDRVYFAGLTKKNVRRGDWRYLTEKEVNMLRMGAFE